MFEAQRFMDQLRGEAPELNPLESALAAGWVEDRRDQVAADKAAAGKQADLEARLEAQAFAERQFGQPTAELRRCQAALGEAEAAAAELREKLEKAERRCASYRGNVEFWAARAQLVVDAAQRSVPERLEPFQRAQLLRQDADRAGRKALERARTQVRRRGGVSFRSTAATAPDVPAGCTRVQYEAQGFCGCLNCFEFDAGAQARGLAAMGMSYR